MVPDRDMSQESFIACQIAKIKYYLAIILWLLLLVFWTGLFKEEVQDYVIAFYLVRAAIQLYRYEEEKDRVKAKEVEGKCSCRKPRCNVLPDCKRLIIEQGTSAEDKVVAMLSPKPHRWTYESVPTAQN